VSIQHTRVLPPPPPSFIILPPSLLHNAARGVVHPLARRSVAVVGAHDRGDGHAGPLAGAPLVLEVVLALELVHGVVGISSLARAAVAQLLLLLADGLQHGLQDPSPGIDEPVADLIDGEPGLAGELTLLLLLMK